MVELMNENLLENHNVVHTAGESNKSHVYYWAELLLGAGASITPVLDARMLFDRILNFLTCTFIDLPRDTSINKIQLA